MKFKNHFSCFIIHNLSLKIMEKNQKEDPNLGCIIVLHVGAVEALERKASLTRISISAASSSASGETAGT